MYKASPAEEISHILNSDKFPDNIDWNAAYALLTDNHSPQSMIPDSLWIEALEYEGPGISDMLRNGDTYHAPIGPMNQLVGFTFTFGIDPRGRIIATGTCHSAYEDVRGDVHTLFDTALDTQKIAVLLKDELSERVATTWVRECGLTPEKPDTRPPADAHEIESATMKSEFPDDLDRNAMYGLIPRGPGENGPIEASVWVSAIKRNDTDALDTLTSPETDIMLIGPLQAPVGFKFEFATDQRGHITAIGACYPATRDLGHGLCVNEDNPLDSRQIIILPNSERTETLIREYIRNR